MTLHEAIERVLLDGRKPMKASDIARVINSLGLYKRDDNKPVPASQISARVSARPDMFSRSGEMIALLNPGKTEIRRTALKAFDLTRGAKGVNPEIVLWSLFFKRVIDNPDLQSEIFGMPVSFNCDIHDFGIFTELLGKTYTELQSLHSSIFSDILKLSEIKTGFEAVLPETGSMDLRSSVVPDRDFSELLFNIIRSTVTRDFNQGGFMTPDTLAGLISGIAELSMFSSLYNPAAGIGTFPVWIKRLNSSSCFSFKGEEINLSTFLLSFINLAVNHIPVCNFHNEDSLKQTDEKFDLVVCCPPVNVRIPDNNLTLGFPASNRSHILFLRHVINSIDKGGRGMVFMPEGFLFSDGNVERAYKKYILQNRLLEGIISLPAGIFAPYSGIKTSLLVLSKKENKRVYLIDASVPAFQKSDDNRLITLDNEKIIDVIRRYSSGGQDSGSESAVSDEQAEYFKKYTETVPIDSLGNDLSVSKLLCHEVNEPESENLTSLREVLDHFNPGIKNLFLKQVSISDLNKKYYDYILGTETLRVHEKPGKLLNRAAILMGSIAGSYKPTYYNQADTVSVSPAIHIFTIKEGFKDRVLPEYIIYELGNELFQQKLNGLAVGVTSLKRVSYKDILSMRINIPDIRQQEAILKLKKEAILNEKLIEAKNLGEAMGLNTKSASYYLRFIEHELNNVSGGINNNIRLLKSFVKSRDISFETKVSDRKNASSVNEVFDSIESNVSDIRVLLENISKILDISDTKPNLAETGFRSFIYEECRKQSELSQKFKIYIGIDNQYDSTSNPDVLMDKELFGLVIRNFIVNSAKHGYDEGETTRRLIFNLTWDDDYYYINMINDGKPFPESFSPGDFMEFGKRGGTTSGSGIGGFIMAEVAKKHGGQLAVISDNELLQVKTKEETLVIRKGVHFQIQLPKTV